MRRNEALNGIVAGLKEEIAVMRNQGHAVVEHAEGQWAQLQDQRTKMMSVLKDTEQRPTVSNQAAEE